MNHYAYCCILPTVIIDKTQVCTHLQHSLHLRQWDEIFLFHAVYQHWHQKCHLMCKLLNLKAKMLQIHKSPAKVCQIQTAYLKM